MTKKETTGTKKAPAVRKQKKVTKPKAVKLVEQEKVVQEDKIDEEEVDLYGVEPDDASSQPVGKEMPEFKFVKTEIITKDYKINFKKITTVHDVVGILKALDVTYRVDPNHITEELAVLIATNHIKAVE